MKKVLKSTLPLAVVFGLAVETALASDVLLIKGNGMLKSQSPVMQQEEVSTQERLLTEMGHTLTVIDEPAVTQENLNEYDLVIYTNAGSATLASQSTFDTLRIAYQNGGIPLYFLGDDVAYMISRSGLNNVEDLLLVRSTSNNGSASTITLSHSHPIGLGVSSISYNRDIDVTSVFSTEILTIGNTSSGHPAVVTYENQLGTRITTQLVNIKAANEGIVSNDVAGLANLEKLYQNSINWLLANQADDGNPEGSYQDGYEAGQQACLENPSSCGIGICEPATLTSDFKMHLPLLHYSPSAANDSAIMPLWVDLKIADYEQLLFKVTHYGVIEEE